jgi:hypothetical protein
LQGLEDGTAEGSDEINVSDVPVVFSEDAQVIRLEHYCFRIGFDLHYILNTDKLKMLGIMDSARRDNARVAISTSPR